MATIRQGVRPVKVASGEHAANRVMLKQFLQARAIDVTQIGACRAAGVNENLAHLLLAAKLMYRSARTRAARDGAR
jgi:L-fuconate dehydratase